MMNEIFEDEKNENEESPNETLKLKIITNTTTTLIFVKPSYTIEQVKQQVEEKLKLPRDGSKVVKLIYRGRILEDGNTVESERLSNESFIHCTITSPPPPDQQIRQAEEIVDDNQIRGFDRFRYYGFSDVDIQQLRQQFHAHRLMSTGFLGNLSNEPNQLLNMEEEWINSEAGSSGEQPNETVINMPPSHEDEESEYGTNEDLVKGIVMGFMLGFIMLLFLPESSLKMRTKVGIITGLSVSISFGILRLIIY